MTFEDPAERMARIREEFARQNAKRGEVDSNGRPVEPPAPVAPTAQAEPAEPQPPAPNPAQGSSSMGAAESPDPVRAARESGGWAQAIAYINTTHRPQGFRGPGQA